MFGGGKRVLMMGGDGIELYATGGTLTREIALPWSVPDFDMQLIAALAKDTSKPVLVLYDGAEQTYNKPKNIPKLSALDRPKFVKRKLDLAFPSYPIRAWMEIKHKRGHDVMARSEGPSYLFVGLPETEQIDRIGNALLESGAPVAGFGLLPMESTGLVAELSKKCFGAENASRWSVLISQHETGGLRQVVIKDGELTLTRLTPPTDAGLSGAAWAEETVREFKATLTYITRFGYNPAEGLDVVVVGGAVEKQFFDGNDLGATNFKFITVPEALQLSGIKAFGFDKAPFADVLHAAWAGKKRALKLPVRVPSIHRIMAPRLAARAAGGLMVLSILGAAYLAFTDFQTYNEVQQDIVARESQKQMLDREYQSESRVFDALPVRPEVVKGTLAAKKTLEDQTVRIAPVMTKLRKSLGNDVYLSALDYSHTPAAVLQLGVAAGAKTIKPGVAKADDRGKIKILFKFGLPDNMPLEQKVLRAEAMEKQLLADFPGYDVRILTQFGNVTRQGKFEGGLGSGAANLAAKEDLAEFVLEGPPL